MESVASGDIKDGPMTQPRALDMKTSLEDDAGSVQQSKDTYCLSMNRGASPRRDSEVYDGPGMDGIFEYTLDCVHTLHGVQMWGAMDQHIVRRYNIWIDNQTF